MQPTLHRGLTSDPRIGLFSDAMLHVFGDHNNWVPTKLFFKSSRELFSHALGEVGSPALDSAFCIHALLPK